MSSKNRKITRKVVPTSTSTRIRSTTVVVCVVPVALAVVGMMIWAGRTPTGDREDEARSRLTLDEIPFDGRRAFRYLEQICALGRRPSGSEGMAAQQDLLEKHFQALGATVHRQSLEYAHPQTGEPVPMTNLTVEWAPERADRVLLACHYDTLPYPLEDPHDPFGEFIGANDGGSGVALLMALGHEIPNLLTTHQTLLGVDFVFLDGEEFLFVRRGGRYFVGSEFFARKYAAGELPYQADYHWAVLLDMIGDADLRIPQEANGLSWPDTRPLVEEIYGIARRLDVKEFVPRRGREIQDDHIMLRNVGKIPTVDLIDFDYPPWHTTGDTLERCSALSLAKVGWVVREWLKTAKPAAGND